MRVDQRLRNGQAKPEASKAARDFSLALLECVKDLVDFFLFDADAGVDDAGLNFIRRRVKSLDSDSASFRSKFHAVLDQIPKDLLQSRRIALHMGVSSAKVKFHFQILRFDFFSTYLVSALQDLVHANSLKA